TVTGEPGVAPAGDQYVTQIQLVTVAGPAAVTVTPATPGPYAVGTAVTFNVTVLDSSGNRTTDSGPITVTLNPGDPNATIVNGQVTNGAGSFTVTFGTPGTYTVTANVGGTVNLAGSVSNVVVTSGGGGGGGGGGGTGNLTGTLIVGSSVGGDPNGKRDDGAGQLRTQLTAFPA